jgi:hypothetical protein
MNMNGKIRKSPSIYSALGYNLRKQKNGSAEYLWAENFIKSTFELTRKDILHRFHQRTSLNEESGRNIFHIAICFDTTEKISNELMRDLAKRYMTGLGYKDQPYLIYRHFDAAHPHCHVITTSVQANGDLIDIGPPDFRKARHLVRNLEQEFGLVKFKRTRLEDKEKFKVHKAQRVIYGKSGLKRSISDVLNTVVDNYRYTSMNELNAILRCYNVRANPGQEQSNLRRHKGLLYHALDEKGSQKGKSIKASDFALKPTLAKLEKKFVLNESLREGQHERVKTAINWTLAGTPPDWKGFQESLEKEGIAVVLLPEKKNGPEGIYFVDHTSKAVFNGESLGESYRLEAIRQRCGQGLSQEEGLEERHRHRLEGW